ncbi:MAG TPA: L,D-transpeptidase [Thermoanaerobaculia bacterium]|jgi:lipoprotein-anchoring transpeptidase ErfK/SrfK|nr:L,D-transpeptidase [Thermoanaerobaculia bacterium]
MKTIGILAMTALTLMACNPEQVQQTTSRAQDAAQKVEQKVSDTLDVSTPLGAKEPPMTPQEREKARFDQQWRQLQSFRAQQAAQAAAVQQQQAAAQQAALQQAAQTSTQLPPNITIVHGQKESFKGLDANAINSASVNLPISGDLRGPSVLKTQVYLDRNHFSVGSIDGRWGRNSAITVWWWQKAHGLPPTGDVDDATFGSIAHAAGGGPVVVPYTITADDTKGPFVSIPDDPYEKAKLTCMCYETLREELAERFHSSEDFIEQLNPNVKINDLQPGATINVPNVRPAVTQDQPDIANIAISIAGNSYNGFDASGNVIFHAPTTLGSGYDPSPDETLHVVEITPMPHFHYDPTLYHEVPDSEPDAHMNPGPNSPVGVVWMALSKPHYGMHGTPDPDSIGYASSHGCVRLTNWDAQEVSHRIKKGISVAFVDTTSKNMPEVAKK